MQSMLAAHPEIIMMPETGFIRRHLVRTVWSLVSANSLKRLKGDVYLKRWGKDGVLPDLTNGSFSEGPLVHVYQTAVKKYSESSGNSNVAYVGDKDPKMIEVLPHLDDIITDYKIVHIIRDPRDVFLSKNKAAWSKRQSVMKKLVANAAQLRIANNFKRSNNKIFEVKYEDLLMNPCEVLSDICLFLEIVYDPQMLNFQEKAKELVSTDEMSWKKETMGPLLKNNFSKWREELTAEQCDLIEKCCGLAMEKGNYDRHTETLPWYLRVKNIIYSGVVNCLAIIYAFKASKLYRAR